MPSNFVKTLGINLIKGEQVLYIETSKHTEREFKRPKAIWRYVEFINGKLNILKMLIFYKLI